MGGALTRGRLLRRVEAPALVGLAALVLLVCCLVPLVGVGSELFTEGAIPRLDATLGRASTWELLLRSIGLALAVTVCATALGVPMGVLLGRTDLVGRRAALFVHVFPMALPPFLLALGWFHLLGRQGAIGTEPTSDLLFGPVGVVGVSTLAFTPAVSALVALGLQGIDPSLDEAAQVAASPFRVATRILVPLAWRSIALSAIVVFALALSEIGVPMFLRVRTYPAAVFTRVGGIDYAPGEAAALVLPLLALGLLLVAIERGLLHRRSEAGSFGSRSGESAPLRLGRARPVASLAAWVVILVSLLPLAALAWRAGGAGLRDAAPWIRSSLTTSLVVSATAATVIVMVGVMLGHALARRRRGGAALDTVALLGFMTPASVLGVGLITAWNRPGTQLVYATAAILVLGLSARYAVLGMRTMDAVFSRSSPHYEEAAACSGGGFTRRLLRILVPMHARGIAGAWLVALVFCLRDLDTVVVFYPPGLEPLVVRIFTLEANGPEQVVAGLSLYHVALTGVVLLGGWLLLRPRWRDP